MKVAVKYVTSRRNGDGTLRWYWQRAGHPLTRLPDQEPDRVAVALRLNAEAEGRKAPTQPAHLIRGTVAWLVERYQESPKWTERAKKTKIAYSVWLRRIEAQWGDLPITALTKSVVVEWVDSIETPANKLMATAVLSRIFRTAIRYDLVTVNHARELELSTPAARDVHFLPADVTAWLEAAARHPRGREMALAFSLLIHTGQRVGDCLRMPWSRYKGDRIELRQKKTHKLLAVPCHRELRAILDAAKADRGASTLIVGAKLGHSTFNTIWNRICAMAALEDKQARDLRRTMVVKLGEAGCTEAEISAITGHSLSEIRSMLDTVYLVRTEAMALAAIAKLENASRTESNAALESRLKTG